MMRRALLPSKKRSDADGKRRDPNKEAQDGGSLSRHDGIIIEWASHADVAIYRDDAEGHDARRATKNIHCCPHVAEDGSEIPSIRHLKQ